VRQCVAVHGSATVGQCASGSVRQCERCERQCVSVHAVVCAQCARQCTAVLLIVYGSALDSVWQCAR
jgi:hypothetical protein